MSGQLDIFATSAAENAIPDTNWTKPEGAERYWCPGNGPHATWDDFAASLEDGDRVEVYRDKQGYRAYVYANRDRVSGLWVGHCDEGNFTGESCGIATYSPAAYRTKDDCLAAWKEIALQRIENRKKRDGEYAAWRKKFDDAHAEERRARIAADLDSDEDPGTGEEGMAERYAASLVEQDFEDN